MSKDNWDAYRSDLRIAFLCRAVIALGMLSILASMLGACSADQDRSRALDLAVKGSYTPGEGNLTRNQPPQGGIDEKSGSTPTKPME